MTLLNCTIRFVHQDTDSALPYARHPTGCYAFVLYYRLRRTPDADAVLRRYHAALAAPTLKVGGTFYLPYRHHYTDAELAAAYPGLAAFAEAKARHDPSGVFSNLWWDRYAPEPPRRPKHVAVPCVWQPAPASPSEEEAASMPLLMPPVRSRRKNSFRSLMASPRLRSAFFEGFLQEVFNLMPAAELRRLISAACWDSRLEDDDAIYTNLRAAVAARSSSPLSQLSSLWAGVKQLSEQKRELTRETVALLARLGKVGQIHSLVSVGDHGKLVLPLRAALGMRGPVWVVHDSEAPQDDTPAVLERGAMSSADVGTFVRIDYNDVVRGRPLAAIPEGAADLVTMNQGACQQAVELGVSIEQHGPHEVADFTAQTLVHLFTPPIACRPAPPGALPAPVLPCGHRPRAAPRRRAHRAVSVVPPFRSGPSTLHITGH